MSESVIGKINGIDIEKYSVLQVSDDNGATWLDFSALREPFEVAIAKDMVDLGGGIRGHRKAAYRIVQNGVVVY